MKKSKIFDLLRLWCMGILLFLIRLIQLHTDFDPVTGLALHSRAGRNLWIGLLVLLAFSIASCFFRPKGSKRSYACCFDAPGTPAIGGLAAGGFLLIAGGGLLLFQALTAAGTTSAVAVAAGLFGVAGGAGLVILAKSLQNGSPSLFALLPAMFFSVLFVLTVYFPEETNPVLEQFFPPVLGAAMAAYFFYQFSGFFRGEGSLRGFDFISNFAAAVCIAAAADCLSNPGRLLVYLGFAVTVTVFRFLLREEPLPEPEKPAEEKTA